jgi:hypothetical protein
VRNIEVRAGGRQQAAGTRLVVGIQDDWGRWSEELDALVRLGLPMCFNYAVNHVLLWNEEIFVILTAALDGNFMLVYLV